MTDPLDLKHAFSTLTDVQRPAADPLDDLARARVARTARNRRRFRVGLAGLTVTAVLGVGVGVVLGDAGESRDSGAGGSQGQSSSVRLVAERFDATPYTFDLTPVGWSVQGENPYAVTIAPDDGSVSTNPDDFVGKLVILFDANPPNGRLTSFKGREVWVQESSDYVTMATRARDSEPAGIVRIQYPRKTGWDTSSMQAFLTSVHVGDTAQHGQG
jgi:hypothetical protein